ncbi:hypothetical protein HYX17_00500 [Candidatus Woesearchaeota archaeon]|nr:hypothetical protein [Candidatus Woesearchaeota archaeon]
MNTKGRRGGGGLGFSTKQPQLEFVCSTFNQCRIITADKILENVVSGYANKMCDEYHLPGILVEIKNSYPVHFGLGSETQSALAVGNALKELYQKRNISNEEIAKSTGVAGVSGIGYYSFAKGGFIIEAGYPMAPDLEKKNFELRGSERVQVTSDNSKTISHNKFH